MQYVLSLFLIATLYTNTLSQTHRFLYEVHYKKDSTQENTTKDHFVLDINPSSIIYYNRGLLVQDSLIKSNSVISSKTLAPSEEMFSFIKHDAGKRTFDSYELLGMDMIKLSGETEQQWILHNDKKELQEMQLQKATTFWKGRNWIAWFASEIPFPEGPYKFHGLPGLITEIEDDRGNFSFKLIKSEKIDQVQEIQAISFWTGHAIMIDWEKYIKIKKNFYQDPLSFLSTGKVNLTNEKEKMILTDGTVVDKNNKRQVIKDQQQKIKKFNNPIELDQVINYPDTK